MTAIGPYSMATEPLVSTVRHVPLGKAVECDSILMVLKKYVPNYYNCVVLADMERVYSDSDRKQTVFAFDQVTCASKINAINYCRNTTYEGELLPLSLTSSRRMILPTAGTDFLSIDSPDGLSVFVNNFPIKMSIVCKNGVVYVSL